MKLRLSMAMCVAALAFTGCDKKDAGAPAPSPTQVQPAPGEPSAAPATTNAASPSAAAANEAAHEAAGHACGGNAQHAGHDHACGGNAHDHAAGHACGGNAQHAGHDHAAGEVDCPFKGESGVHVADSKPAEEAIGCGGKPLVEAAATPSGGIHYGKRFELPETSPLAQVASGAGDGQELTVRVAGTIDKVCQKKGCWMVVKDGEVEARVIMKDAAFTVPLDSTGRPAQVEGTLKVRVFTEAQAKHLAEDGGQDPAKVTGERRELLLMATSVEIGG